MGETEFAGKISTWGLTVVVAEFAGTTGSIEALVTLADKAVESSSKESDGWATHIDMVLSV